MAVSVIRYHGQLSSCTVSEKTNDPSLRKRSDGRSDGRTDGMTDGREYLIERCPTNVELRKMILYTHLFIFAIIHGKM